MSLKQILKRKKLIGVSTLFVTENVKDTMKTYNHKSIGQLFLVRFRGDLLG